MGGIGRVVGLLALWVATVAAVDPLPTFSNNLSKQLDDGADRKAIVDITPDPKPKPKPINDAHTSAAGSIQRATVVQRPLRHGAETEDGTNWCPEEIGSWADWVLVILAAVAAWVGHRNLRIIGQQTRLADKSAEAAMQSVLVAEREMRISSRPWVVVNSGQTFERLVEIVLQAARNPATADEEVEFHVVLELKNTGTSPAFNITLTTEWRPYGIGESVPDSIDMTKADEQRPMAPLAPNSIFHHPIAGPTMSVSELAHFYAPGATKRMAIFGILEYSSPIDVKTRHVTKFCLVQLAHDPKLHCLGGAFHEFS